jgi:hypothetical protein
MADHTDDPENRKTLRDIATAYERLATCIQARREK